MAGTEVGNLYYDLTINDKKLRSGLDASDSRVRKFGDSVAKVGKVMAASFAVLGAGAVAFGVASVKAFSESENAIAQTNAVLKSTGGVAKVTADQVTELANAFQKTTKFSDEEIRSAENMLLTFTNISKDIFPDTTKTVLDMSQALGQDLKSSSIQLGKALNNPIDGITALTRVGVKFTDSQKEQIESLVKAGKVMDAQKIILKELQIEFGGSAEAAGKTFAGKMAILKNSLNDVQETIGGVIVDALQPFAMKLSDVVKNIDWDAVIRKTIRAISILWKDYIVPFATAIHDIGTEIAEYLTPKFEALWHTIQDRLVPILSDLWHNVIEPLAPVLGTTFVLAVGAVVDIINILLEAIGFLYQAFKDGNPIVLALAGVFGTLAAAMAFNAAFNAITLGFNTLRLITIPQTMATIGAFRALLLAPIVMPAVAVGAAVATIMLVYNAAVKTKKALDDLLATQDANAKSDAEVTKRWQTMVAEGRRTGNQAMIDKGIAGLKHMAELDARARATGGPVNRGMPYLVGERGPELFIPSTSGQILSNEKTMNGNNKQVTVNIGQINNRQDENYVMRRMDRALVLEGLGLST